MSDFKHIPEELWPREEEHVDYEPVYRAVMNDDVLKVDDFLPSIIEYKNQRRSFKNLVENDRSVYGVSVFTKLKNLNETLSLYSAFRKKTKAIAIGRTTLIRGVSTRESEKHHVDYYLYDYEKNSPKDDFEIFELRSANE